MQSHKARSTGGGEEEEGEDGEDGEDSDEGEDECDDCHVVELPEVSVIAKRNPSLTIAVAGTQPLFIGPIIRSIVKAAPKIWKWISKAWSKTPKPRLGPSQKRAIEGLKKEIKNHQQKLKEYQKNPYAKDNKDFLKGKTKEQQKKIISTRIENLKHQIKTFKKDIKAIESGKKTVLEKLPKK